MPGHKQTIPVTPSEIDYCDHVAMAVADIAPERGGPELIAHALAALKRRMSVWHCVDRWLKTGGNS